MIQELFGGSNVGIIGGDRPNKISSPGLILDGNPNTQSPAPTAGAAAAAAGASPSSALAPPPETLRCPRCDSSNTKFCYYNNYNLTQPRHFCKTCRRYWTKGGALRNVPIGGGCRKNKSTAIAAAVGKSGGSVGKLKSSVTNEIGKSAAALFGGFDHGGETAALASNPIIWAATSQNSHFLSLLRSNPNPNPNANSLHLQKDDAPLFGQSNWTSESSIAGGRVINLDPVSHLHITPTGLSNSVYRNQTQAILPGDGFQELYQRLRSSSGCYPDHTSVIPGNLASANSAILESAPIATGELGFWNSTISWPSDMPTTTNGAYP